MKESTFQPPQGKSKGKEEEEEEEEPCCEGQKIKHAMAASASEKELKKYSVLLSEWAKELRVARELATKGGTKGNSAQKLVTSFVDGNISKNNFEASLKKLEL